MNEKTLSGIQLSAEGAQITWYERGMEDAVTLTVPGERADGMMELPSGVFEAASGKNQSPEKRALLRSWLSRVLDLLPERKARKDLAVCITVPELRGETPDNLVEALEELGVQRKYIFLQDYWTSFYYYVVNQRRELWNGDVAFIQYRDEQMIGHILHIDRGVKPGLVTIDEVARTDVSDRVREGRDREDWDRERDRLLYELLGKLFERRNVSTSYLYGPYFDSSWAVRSFQYLTFRRHAFQGHNLFSKGACFGAMARMGLITMPELLYKGVDSLSKNIGINLRVRGKMQYYPLARAGGNWYEAHRECDVIPEGTDSITILSRSPEGAQTVHHVLRLDHFPQRPDRASRLRLTVYFSSMSHIEVEVEDLGFGSMYPSSGRIWKRTIVLE